MDCVTLWGHHLQGQHAVCSTFQACNRCNSTGTTSLQLPCPGTEADPSHPKALLGWWMACLEILTALFAQAEFKKDPPLQTSSNFHPHHIAALATNRMYRGQFQGPRGTAEAVPYWPQMSIHAGLAKSHVLRSGLFEVKAQRSLWCVCTMDTESLTKMPSAGR